MNQLTRDDQRHCPAVLISAPASGQGKTTVTAALARYHKNKGLRVCVFKTGPDFLDPMILERASDAPVYQLDLWMGGETHCRQLLYEAAGNADLILIEGVMGLFDGERSSADLAQLFGIPVLAVIDGSAMAQTFGALAHGLLTYRPNLQFAGVIANRVAGARHYEMLEESLPGAIRSYGWLPRDAEMALPERHLGLVQAAELDDIEQRIERAAAALGDVGAFVSVAFNQPAEQTYPPLLEGARIAVACDISFAFLYTANLDTLSMLGAQLEYFSPLEDAEPPDCDALYLPGGYPELHLAELAANKTMIGGIQHLHAQGCPMVAECGGMLYLLDNVTGENGICTNLAGVLPGQAVLQNRLVSIGMRSVELPEGQLRGHSFHYAALHTDLIPAARTIDARAGTADEGVYRSNRLVASFMHFYFPSNPIATARLFQPVADTTCPVRDELPDQ